MVIRNVFLKTATNFFLEKYKSLHFESVAKREYIKDAVIVYGYNEIERKPMLGLIYAADITTSMLSIEILKVVNYSTEIFAYVVQRTSDFLHISMKEILHFKSAPLHSDYVRYPYDLQ